MSSFSFVIDYLVGGVDKDTDCTCCVDCLLKWFASFKSQESQQSAYAILCHQ